MSENEKINFQIQNIFFKFNYSFVTTNSSYYAESKTKTAEITIPSNDDDDDSTPTAPTAPSGLAAVASGPFQINLTWTDNSSDETSFVIQYGTNGSTFPSTANASTNDTSYSVTGLNPSTTYYFRIKAMNGSLSSDFSSVANATTTADMSTPTSPSGLTVAPSGMAGMDLNWTDNSNNETGFEIQKGDNSGGTCSNWSALTTEAAGTTFYTDATADNSTPTLYCYRVRAVNSNGNSNWVEDYFP